MAKIDLHLVGVYAPKIFICSLSSFWNKCEWFELEIIAVWSLLDFLDYLNFEGNWWFKTAHEKIGVIKILVFSVFFLKLMVDFLNWGTFCQ